MSAADALAGRVTSAFRPDQAAQMTQQTAGVNPNPPADRSASVPADAPPITGRCMIGPYYGTGSALDGVSAPGWGQD